MSHPCAICGDPVPADSDHVEVTGEIVRMQDVNSNDEYLLHTGCWLSVSDGWYEP
jgi:hypothetical protein